MWYNVKWHKTEKGNRQAMTAFTQFTQLEFKILDWFVRTFQSDFLDSVMPIVSMLGNGGWIWILCAGILLIRKNTRKAGLSVAIALVMSYILSDAILKPTLARLRPYDLNPSLRLLIPPPKGFSFPSGHTQASFAAASAMGREHKWLGIGATALACLIAFSRLYLSVHFVTDVLGGAAIGYCLGAAGNGIVRSLRYRYNAKRRKRRKQHA